VTGWLVPSAGQKIPVEPGGYLPLHKIPLAEYRFLQTYKGAEKMQSKNLGSALRTQNELAGISQCITRRAPLDSLLAKEVILHFWVCSYTFIRAYRVCLLCVGSVAEWLLHMAGAFFW
jgi:hypothetical protein